MSKAITNISTVSLIDPLGAKDGLVPVSAYDFKDGLVDKVGSNNGTQYGSLDFVKDRFGTGVRFDGNSYINIGNDSSLRTNSQTISCWVKQHDRTLPNTLQGIITDLSTGTSERLLGISSGLPYLNVGNGSAITTVVSPAAIPLSKWTHIAATIGYDGSSTTTVKLFIDGALVDSDTFSGTVTYSGSNNVIGYINSNRYFNGSISNLEIFNTDLTDTDVQKIYSRSKNIKSYFDRGLIASGKTFSSGFIENSTFYISSTGGYLDSKTTNGYSSKVLTSTVDSFTLSMPTSSFNVNPKQASYGTWEFTIKKLSGDLVIVGLMCKNSSSVSMGDTIVQFEGDDSIRFLDYGLNVLADTVSAYNTWSDYVTVRITRNYANQYKFYLNGVQIGSATTSATLTTNRHVVFQSLDAGTEIILQSEKPGYNFWYSPLVIEP